MGAQLLLRRLPLHPLQPAKMPKARPNLPKRVRRLQEEARLPFRLPLPKAKPKLSRKKPLLRRPSHRPKLHRAAPKSGKPQPRRLLKCRRKSQPSVAPRPAPNDMKKYCVSVCTDRVRMPLSFCECGVLIHNPVTDIIVWGSDHLISFTNNKCSKTYCFSKFCAYS